METICGQKTIFLERRGCNGRIDLAAKLLKELDGQVDALGLGGANKFYHLGNRSYPFPVGQYLTRLVKKTPIVDGSGWKACIEPYAVKKINFLSSGSKALVVSVLDRFWLAESLQSAGLTVMAGDACLGLKLRLLIPLPIFTKLAYLTMPVLSRLPLTYLYPLGSGGKIKYQPSLHPKIKIIAGDWRFIRHHLIHSVADRVIITSGVGPADQKLLIRSGAKGLILTTPMLAAGVSPAANAMEAVLVALGVRQPHYLGLARKFGWLPRIQPL